MDFAQGTFSSGNVRMVLENELKLPEERLPAIIAKQSKAYHLAIFYHVLLDEYYQIMEKINQSRSKSDHSEVFKFEYDFEKASVCENDGWILNECDKFKATELAEHFKTAAAEVWVFIENSYAKEYGETLHVLKNAILNQWGKFPPEKGCRNFWLETKTAI
jgi:hypothetical protein